MTLGGAELMGGADETGGVEATGGGVKGFLLAMTGETGFFTADTDERLAAGRVVCAGDFCAAPGFFFIRSITTTIDKSSAAAPPAMTATGGPPEGGATGVLLCAV